MIFRTYYKLQHIFIAIIQHLTLNCKLLNKKLFTLHCYFWQIFHFFCAIAATTALAVKWIAPRFAAAQLFRLPDGCSNE